MQILFFLEPFFVFFWYNEKLIFIMVKTFHGDRNFKPTKHYPDEHFTDKLMNDKSVNSAINRRTLDYE